MLSASPVRRHQQGMVLLMAVIVLVALTLGALALTRTVYTSTVIAGNLAFQRAAMLSSDLGVEAASSWLESARNGGSIAPSATTCGAPALQCSLPPRQGYLADRSADNLGIANPQTYWTQQLAPFARTVADPDAAGNRVFYVIQRMCMAPGNPADTATTACVFSPDDPARNGSGPPGAQPPPLVYYRITVRVEGPRGTVHMAQAMASL